MSERQRLIELGILTPVERAQTAFDRYLERHFRVLFLDAKALAVAERERRGRWS